MLSAGRFDHSPRAAVALCALLVLALSLRPAAGGAPAGAAVGSFSLSLSGAAEVQVLQEDDGYPD